MPFLFFTCIVFFTVAYTYSYHNFFKICCERKSICIKSVSFTDVKSDLLDDYGMIMTEDQDGGMRALLSGKDVVAAMPTGSGKSLIFQSITYSAAKRSMNYITLIVTPLKAISFTHMQTFQNKVCGNWSRSRLKYYVNTKYPFFFDFETSIQSILNGVICGSSR